MSDKARKREAMPLWVGIVLAILGLGTMATALVIGPKYGETLNSIGLTLAIAAVGTFFVVWQENSARASDEKVDDLIVTVAAITAAVSVAPEVTPSETNRKLDAIATLLSDGRPDLTRQLRFPERLSVLVTGRWPTPVLSVAPDVTHSAFSRGDS
jgi:hypothetical protein